MLRELRIGFVAYLPLARGFFTGALRPASTYPTDDMRSHDDRWQPGNFEGNADTVRRLIESAEGRGITVAQLALAWLLAQGDHVLPIPARATAAAYCNTSRRSTSS